MAKKAEADHERQSLDYQCAQATVHEKTYWNEESRRKEQLGHMCHEVGINRGNLDNCVREANVQRK